MKKYIYIIIAYFSIAISMSCSTGSDSVGESEIDTTPPILNATDIYLRETFVEPYNIEVQYKWDINETDINRILHPPFESSVKPLSNALVKAWIEPYTALGGPDFIKNIAPRQFTLVGSFNFIPNSTLLLLGLAEAGVKITFFNIDYLDFTDVNSIKDPLNTLQHEYTHILNQNIPIDPLYGQINPGNYSQQWFNRSDAFARELGYITAYGSSQETEDFAEMVATMLTNSKTDYDAIVNSISNPNAKSIIRLKESFVAEYYQNNFGIDIYELQALIEAATLELVN